MIKQPNIIPFDIDAQRFILSKLTRYVDKRAVNYLVQNLKANALWTKIYAIYSILGGTASAHKWNLKDLRDLDASYRLEFSAATTHNSNGFTGDGSFSVPIAKTFFTPSVTTPTSILSLSYYSRTSAANVNCIEIGSYDGTNIAQLILKFGDGTAIGGLGVTANASVANSDSKGFYVVSRTSSTAIALYKNGSSIATNATSSTTACTLPITLGIRNGTTALQGSVKQCAFASIGQGLTAAEVFIFNQIVQQFQIILGRAV